MVMYGCETWTIKKAEHQRIDAFQLWCWRRHLRVPWTARRSNQSILKETSWVFIGRTDAEAETPILWPPDAKSWLIGKDWGQNKKVVTKDEMVGWHHRLNDVSLSKLKEIVKDRESWRAAVCGVAKGRAWPSNWTTTNNIHYKMISRVSSVNIVHLTHLQFFLVMKTF